MRKAFQVLLVSSLCVVVASIFVSLTTSNGCSGSAPYKLADCPKCERRAVFVGPDRAVAGHEKDDWAKFECDHCGISFTRYDDGSVLILDRN